MAGIDKNLYKFINTSLEEGISKESRYYYDDPTTVGFNLMFSFESDKNSPLFNESTSGESAIRYLKSINEPEKAERLQSFKNNLRKIVSSYPYYFTDLSGLEGVYELNPDNGFDFERKLTISTLESIDFRIAKLIEEYMLASYDMEYRRQILPSNLIEFDLTIIVSEIRQFRTFVNKTKDNFPLNMKDINNNLTIFVYKFNRCRFDFSTSNPFLNSITNTQPEIATNSFDIIVGKLTTAHQLSFLDLVVELATEDVPVASPVASKKIDNRFETKVKEVESNSKNIQNNINNIDNINPKASAFLQNNDPKQALKQTLRNENLDTVDFHLKNVMNNNNIFTDNFENSLGDPSAEVAKIVLSNDVKSLGNVFGYKDYPASSVLESMVKSNLGNVLDNG